jgi:hypothetical protein
MMSHHDPAQLVFTHGTCNALLVWRCALVRRGHWHQWHGSVQLSSNCDGYPHHRPYHNRREVVNMYSLLNVAAQDLAIGCSDRQQAASHTSLSATTPHTHTRTPDSGCNHKRYSPFNSTSLSHCCSLQRLSAMCQQGTLTP